MVTTAEKTYLTREQARRRAGVTLRTIARYLADGTLTKHTVRRGRRVLVLIDEDELDRLFPVVSIGAPSSGKG